MIETTKQTKEAIAEIQAITGWNNSRLADKLGIFRGSLNSIMNGKTKNPSLSTMDKVEKELARVRKVHG